MLGQNILISILLYGLPGHLWYEFFDNKKMWVRTHSVGSTCFLKIYCEVTSAWDSLYIVHGFELTTIRQMEKISGYKDLSSFTSTSRYLLWFFARKACNILSIHLSIINRRLFDINNKKFPWLPYCFIYKLISYLTESTAILVFSSLPMYDMPHQALNFT